MPEDNQTLAGYNSACDLVFYNAKKKKKTDKQTKNAQLIIFVTARFLT